MRLEGLGDIAFTSARVRGEKLTLIVPSFASVLGAAPGVTAVGSFVQAEGAKVDRLALPPGTKVVEECQISGSAAPSLCPPVSTVAVEMVAIVGTSIRAEGDGEAAVAGSVRASALGRRWSGLVVAVEAGRLRSSAAYADGRWTLTADGQAARQLWVDVWPVVDTTLRAASAPNSPNLVNSYHLRILWTNIGFASSQVFEAEGVGPAAAKVGFSLNKTEGHDAGLHVRRGDSVRNLAGGGDVDSNQPPGRGVDRGLLAPAGTTATIILRGNFPDVSVPLAFPPA